MGMVAVPEEHKDEKYWEKRLKNKEATRRSREAKRLKQNQIALRAAHLERENKNLREQIESAKKTSTELAQETDELKARLRLLKQDSKLVVTFMLTSKICVLLKMPVNHKPFVIRKALYDC